LKNIYLIIFLTVYLLLIYVNRPVCQIVQPRPVTESERRTIYSIDDFINYSDIRFVRSVSVGNTYVYFGTPNGILRINKFSKEFDFPYTYCSGLASDNIKLTLYDNQMNILFVVSDVAVSYYSEGYNWWENVPKSSFGLSKNDQIINIGISDSYVWLNTDRGFFKGNKMNPHFVMSNRNEVKNNNVKWKNVNKVYKDEMPYFDSPPGYIYFHEGKLQDSYLREFPFTDFQKDLMNNVWIGTWGLGALLGNLNINNFDIYSMGTAGPSVYAIFKDAFTIWVGGFNNTSLKGITRWNTKKNEWDYFESYKIPKIRSTNINFINGNKKYIFFASDDGLIVFDKAKSQWKNYTTHNNLPSNYITHVEIFNNEVWISTDIGVAKMTLHSFIIKVVDVSPLKNYHIYATIADKNFVWCATELGVFELNRETGDWIQLKGAPGMLQIKNRSAYKNKDEIWSVSDGGLQMYNIKNKKWTAFPRNVYFQNINFNYILATDKLLWCATNSGLIKYNRKDEFWKVYTKSDGLPSNIIHFFIMDGDYIWLATDKGLTKFYWNNPKYKDIY